MCQINPQTPDSRRNTGTVVIGRNEGLRLIKCLHSLANICRFVVYVDSGSTDGSPESARSLGAQVVELDMSTAFTAARARNAGFAFLQRWNPDIQYVQFIDGDCALNPNWLATASGFLDGRPGVAAVCGRLRELSTATSIYNRLCELEWQGPTGEVTQCGGIAMMRTSRCREVGGFNEGLIAGEEPELCMRFRAAGFKIWRLAEDMADHDADIHRLSQWWRRSKRTGYAYASVVHLHWNSPLGIWRRELARSLGWGLVLPSALVASLIIYPAIAVALAIGLAAQVTRIALRKASPPGIRWIYAVLMQVTKSAEGAGALQYAWRTLSGSSHRIIEYKRVSGRQGSVDSNDHR